MSISIGFFELWPSEEARRHLIVSAKLTLAMLLATLSLGLG